MVSGVGWTPKGVNHFINTHSPFFQSCSVIYWISVMHLVSGWNGGLELFSVLTELTNSQGRRSISHKLTKQQLRSSPRRANAWYSEITGREFHRFTGQRQGLEVLDVKNNHLPRTWRRAQQIRRVVTPRSAGYRVFLVKEEREVSVPWVRLLIGIWLKVKLSSNAAAG